MTNENVIGSNTQVDSSTASGTIHPPLNVIIPTQGEQQEPQAQTLT